MGGGTRRGGGLLLLEVQEAAEERSHARGCQQRHAHIGQEGVERRRHAGPAMGRVLLPPPCSPPRDVAWTCGRRG